MAPSKHAKPKRTGLSDSDLWDLIKINNIQDGIDFLMLARKTKEETGDGALLNEFMKPFKKLKDPMKRIEYLRMIMTADRETLESVFSVIKPETSLDHGSVTFHCLRHIMRLWRGHGAGIQNEEGLQIDPKIWMLHGLSGACKTTFIKAFFMEVLGIRRVWTFNKPEDVMLVPLGSIQANDGLIFNELSPAHFRNLSELKNFAERGSGSHIMVRFQSVYIPAAVHVAFTSNAKNPREWIAPMCRTAEARANAAAMREDVTAFLRKTFDVYVDYCLSLVPAVKDKFMETQCKYGFCHSYIHDHP